MPSSNDLYGGKIYSDYFYYCRLGGILKGGRLWRSNSSDGKKVVTPPEEPDVVKCTERDRDQEKETLAK